MFGKCRWAVAPEKMAPPRTGHHPREPRSRGTAEPTQEATHRDLPPDEDEDPTPAVDEPLAGGWG